MKLLKFFIFSGFFAALPLTGFALESQLDGILAEKDDATQTVLSYPSEIRQAALEASLYPNTIFEMDQKQKQSSEQFQSLLAKYPRKTQEKVYNLVRYPNLIQELVQGGQKSKDQIKALTGEYPKSIQDAAEDLGRNEYTLLRDVELLNRTNEQEFENLIRGLPSSSQNAFRTLLTYPEALQTLAENKNLTLALGEAYRANPSETLSKLNQVSQTATTQNEEALEDYRETIKKDPKAQAEMKASAQAFAQEYGYSSDDYQEPPPANYSGSSGNTVVNINVNPYPYWSGYPYWYSRPFWRPYPLWALTGFFWGFGGGPVVYNYPSYAYTNWFYSYPRNFYRYPYLSNCYGSHYYRYRDYRSYNGFHRVVNNWHRDHYRYTNNDMWRHDRRGADRWRDYGHRNEKSRSFYGYQNNRGKDRNEHGRKGWDGRGYWDKDRNNQHDGKDRNRWHSDKDRNDRKDREHWRSDKNGKDKDRGAWHSDKGRHDKGRNDKDRQGNWQNDKNRKDKGGWNQDKRDHSDNGRRARGEPSHWEKDKNRNNRGANWHSEKGKKNPREGWGSGNKDRNREQAGNNSSNRGKVRRRDGANPQQPEGNSNSRKIDHSSHDQGGSERAYRSAPKQREPSSGASNQNRGRSQSNEGGFSSNRGQHSGSTLNRGSSTTSRSSFRSSGGSGRSGGFGGGGSRGGSHSGSSRGRR